MNIRKVVAADRQMILDLLQKVSLFTAEEIACAMELLTIYLDNPSQRDYEFYCAADSAGKLCGFFCYGKTPLTDAVYHLYWIAVDSDAQNRGVGKILLAHLDDLLMAKGARMLLAETSSKVSYGKTRAFYRKNGFQEISRIPDYYAENDGLIVYGKFYSLYERRRATQWKTLIEGRSDLTGMFPTGSGTIGTGRFEIASER